MSSVADEELKATGTEGYKGPGKVKTAEELEGLDYRDESLKNWEKQLGAAPEAGSGSGAQVKVLSISLTSASRSAGPIVFDLSQGRSAIQAIKGKPVTIKEGSEYSVNISFMVQNAVVAGLKYIQIVKRAGIKIEKWETMIGSYAPQASPYNKKFLDEDAPSGMIARSGSYTVRSRVTDDDDHVHADFEWSFKLSKDW